MKIKTIGLGLGMLVAFATPSAAQWDGCGMGVGGGFLMGELTNGGPAGAGAQGEKAGVTLNCDRKMGAFVAGAEVNYDWYFGDLKTLGAQHELSILGRLGVLTNNQNLLYLGAGWGRATVSTGGFNADVNSWKLALGDEFRIPNSPMYLDLRGTYSRYSESDLGLPSTAKMDSLEVMGRLKFKFGPGMFGKTGDLFTSEVDPTPVHSDPKLSAPKKP